MVPYLGRPRLGPAGVYIYTYVYGPGSIDPPTPHHTSYTNTHMHYIYVYTTQPHTTPPCTQQVKSVRVWQRPGLKGATSSNIKERAMHPATATGSGGFGPTYSSPSSRGTSVRSHVCMWW